MTRSGTRERILDVALRLFAERGYAGTSVRDIAEELDITKAAVHYHFAAKEQIVAALLAPFLERVAEAVVRAPAGAPPEVVLTRLGDVLAEGGPMFGVLMGDPSVSAASAALHAELEGLAVRTAVVLAGPRASRDRLLRAHAALGAFAAGSRVAGAAGPPSAAQRRTVLQAALAALGQT